MQKSVIEHKLHIYIVLQNKIYCAQSNLCVISISVLGSCAIGKNGKSKKY